MLQRLVALQEAQLNTGTSETWDRASWDDSKEGVHTSSAKKPLCAKRHLAQAMTASMAAMPSPGPPSSAVQGSCLHRVAKAGLWSGPQTPAARSPQAQGHSAWPLLCTCVHVLKFTPTFANESAALWESCIPDGRLIIGVA
jgi:hypothetical protein